MVASGTLGRAAGHAAIGWQASLDSGGSHRQSIYGHAAPASASLRIPQPEKLREVWASEAIPRCRPPEQRCRGNAAVARHGAESGARIRRCLLDERVGLIRCKRSGPQVPAVSAAVSALAEGWRGWDPGSSPSKGVHVGSRQGYVPAQRQRFKGCRLTGRQGRTRRPAVGSPSPGEAGDGGSDTPPHRHSLDTWAGAALRRGLLTATIRLPAPGQEIGCSHRRRLGPSACGAGERPLRHSQLCMSQRSPRACAEKGPPAGGAGPAHLPPPGASCCQFCAVEALDTRRGIWLLYHQSSSITPPAMYSAYSAGQRRWQRPG